MKQRRSSATQRAIRAWAEPLERRVLLAGEYRWPVGAEFQVNTWTTDFQRLPAIAVDDGGNFVVTWEDYSQEGPFNYGIYAQRFNAAGQPLGPQFHVNTFTTNRQAGPSVAMSGDGRFIITWTGDGQTNVADVYAQRYDASGLPQGSEFLVNSYTSDAQQEPSVAMDADGDFVIAWHSRGQAGNDVLSIHAQRYDAGGVPQGAEFVVSSSPASDQRDPVVAMDADGDFIVAWQRYEEIAYTTFYYLYARRFDATGVPLGPEFQVNSTMLGTIPQPSVAMDADGDFVITWVGNYGIHARRFDPTGQPQGGESIVDPLTGGAANIAASVAMSPDGEFVVVWSSYEEGQRDGVFLRRYDAAGEPQQGRSRVNTTTHDLQTLPAVAVDAEGDFVITWQSLGQDGDDYGIYAQRYTTFGPAEAARVGDRVWHDINANGVQEPGEAGIAGALVELYRNDGLPVTSTVTDAAGIYQFGLLPAAGAQLRFVAPPGLIPTRQNQGGDDEVDSDPDRVTGDVALVAGAAGTSDASIDAGFAAPASVSGVVYFDRNGDGVRKGGEEALPGFRVFQDLDSDGILDPDEPAADTGPAGSFTIGTALGGTDLIRVVPQDLWTATSIAPVTIPSGGSVGSVDLPVRTTAPDSVSVPKGNEIHVNNFTTGEQQFPVLAMDRDGNFVVAWQSQFQDGSVDGVYARRYNAAGLPQAPEFRVNTHTTGFQNRPSVAMRGSGDFVVVWTSDLQDGEFGGIYAQRFDANGTPQGDEFRVNATTTGDQGWPAVAMDDDGNFVVAWASYQDLDAVSFYDVYVRRFEAGGAPLGGESRVNVYTTYLQSQPSVAMDADGDFVVAWNSYGQDGTNSSVFARRYDAAGMPIGSEFAVNTFTEEVQQHPAVAMSGEGAFVITWEGLGSDGGGVYAKRYNAGGIAQGTEFRVHLSTSDIDRGPSIAVDQAGDIVIAWAGRPRDGSQYGVYARRFNAAGVPQGAEFQVNTFTLLNQIFPTVAVDGDGNFAIAWNSDTQDGSGYGVYARRYSVAPRPAVTSSQFLWQTAPQRLEFSFDDDVSASLSVSDILIENLTTSTPVAAADIAITWNAATNSAAFTFPTLPNGGSLPDGNYRATLLADGVFNASGTTIAADWAVEFFFLAGDANHDGRVNLQDFNRLAANFGQSGPGIDFTRGDFNYDGRVNLADFNLLAARFGMTLAPAATAISAGTNSDESEDQRLVELD